jgi:hypothetical protein
MVDYPEIVGIGENNRSFRMAGFDFLDLDLCA